VVDRLGEMPQAVDATAEAMFEAVDENADGRISPPEYRRLVEAWAGRATGTDGIFARLGLGHDGHLSRTELMVHWTEFWAGGNPAAPGSWVFGLFPAGRAGRPLNNRARFSRRHTTRWPDQLPSSAATFTSTTPRASDCSRTISLVISLWCPPARRGQAIQSAPFGKIRLVRPGSRRGSSAAAVKKAMITSAGSGAGTCSRPGGGSVSAQPAGGASRLTRWPGRRPSLRCCGVPATRRPPWSSRSSG